MRARCADARALHVRLDGPVERRIVQAMRIERVDEATARRRLPTPTARASARERCVRHLYGVDPADASLYAIVLDGTTLEPAGCPEVVAAAVAHRGRDT